MMNELIIGVVARSGLFGDPARNGTHNGYVLIPEGYKLFGMGYDEIHAKYDISVHGGLTFAESFDGRIVEVFFPVDITHEELMSKLEDTNYWCIGFDTAHIGDNPNDQDYNYVVSELRSLVAQINKLEENEIYSDEIRSDLSAKLARLVPNPIPAIKYLGLDIINPPKHINYLVLGINGIYGTTQKTYLE